ncbi:MAG: hypothetical protein JJE04_03765, partial [Acidobacteriia bacterium]|nr:hypothetical protein [Terriglobia bacterium]
AGATILAGAALYWIDSKGFSSDWMRTGPGIVFGIGGFFGLIGFIFGMQIGTNLNALVKVGSEVQGKPMEGDDSSGAGPTLKDANLESAVAVLPDGYRMIWDRDPRGYVAKKSSLFRFRVEDSGGKPADGMELYMGMMGHAAFLRRDRSVFAHVHPSGSVPMAALGLTKESAADPHAGHAMPAGLPAEVSFPYGFPRPGAYRIFVQTKRAGKVETGVFDVAVK